MPDASLMIATLMAFFALGVLVGYISGQAPTPTPDPNHLEAVWWMPANPKIGQRVWHVVEAKAYEYHLEHDHDVSGCKTTTAKWRQIDVLKLELKA